MMDGDRSIVDLNAGESACVSFSAMKCSWQRRGILRAAAAADAESMSSLPCSAATTAANISPYGEFYLACSFPCLAERAAAAVHRYLARLRALKEVRSIR